jgi:hypothetical protein
LCRQSCATRYATPEVAGGVPDVGALTSESGATPHPRPRRTPLVSFGGTRTRH